MYPIDNTNIVLPLSNVVVDIGKDGTCSEFIGIINTLLVQLKESLFIVKPGFPFGIYFDFSKIYFSVDDSKLVDCIARCSESTLFGNINILVSPGLFDKSILCLVANKKIKLKVILTTHNYKEMLFDKKKWNRSIDINFQVSEKLELINLYRILSQYSFNSIDFILPDNDDLIFFTKELIVLADYYFTKNSKLSVLNINCLVENYFKVKLGLYPVVQNASLVISMKGDILKTVNYLFSGNRTPFLGEYNLYKEKIINIILTNEYYEYFSNSCITRLELDSRNAIRDFIKDNKQECDKKYKSKLALFYRHYSEYLDNFIQK